MVGAGIARPIYADDTVHSQRIVPADICRPMVAPTRCGGAFITIANNISSDTILNFVLTNLGDLVYNIGKGKKDTFVAN